MRATFNTAAVDNDGEPIWQQLHDEREAICAALIKEYPDRNGQKKKLSERDVLLTINWHRDLLQARLRKIDDALDRLMSGSYGNCCKCGRWIEDTKLHFDPTIAYCCECWERLQTAH
jgi:RNA polymerase-binding transcription factor DksA